MEKIKHNRFSKVLVLLMAVMMVLTMMPNGMWGGAETAWATEDTQETVQVTFYFDISSFGTPEALKTVNIEQIPSISVDVPKGTSLQAALQKYVTENKDKEGAVTFVGLDNAFITQINDFGNYSTEAFSSLMANLRITNPDKFIFGGAGWTYSSEEVNGEGLQNDKVTQKTVVNFRYTLYYVWNATLGDHKYDWEFVDAYQALAAKNAEAQAIVDAGYEGFSEEQKSTLNEKLTAGKNTIQSIDDAASGLWVNYIAKKGTMLWGDTTNMQNATEELNDAINRTPTPTEITYKIKKGDSIYEEGDLSTVKFYHGDVVQIIPTVLPEGASQKVTYQAFSTFGSVDETGQFTFPNSGSKGMVTIKSVKNPSITKLVLMTVTAPPTYAATFQATDGLTFAEGDTLQVSDTDGKTYDGVLSNGEFKVSGLKAGTYNYTFKSASGVTKAGTLTLADNLTISLSGKDKNATVNALMENIAQSYVDKTSDWHVMDMGAYANLNPTTQYKTSAEAKQTYINNAISYFVGTSLSDTEIDKRILALTAIGGDVTQLYRVNNNTPISAITLLNGVAQSTSVWSAPYTLAAYNQGNYAGTESYETALVNALVASQEANGSWNDYGTIDTTANAIAGLAFYADRADVKTAIENGVNYLASQQEESGAFRFNEQYGENANSTATVIIGLAAAGVNPDTDPRFIKNGNSALDGLLSFALNGNTGFWNGSDTTTVDDSATEQSFRALIAAAQVMQTGKAYNVYDFSQNPVAAVRATGEGTPTPKPADPTGDDMTVTFTIKADTGYWLNSSKITIKETGATVYHAFVKACEAAGISYVGAENGYVSSMTKAGKTLAEFTNGKNSGWMYKVNGTLPEVGLTSCSIKNGDDIVWFYTNDWTTVPGAMDFMKSETKSDVTTSGASGSATTTAPTDVKVSEKTNADGTKETVAAVKVDSKHHDEIIKQAAEKKSAEIVLEVSKADSKGADNVQLTLDVTFVKNVADKTNADLTVNTENGKVTLDQETIKTVLSAAKGATITLEVSKVEKPTEAQKKAAGANGHVISLTVKSGNQIISDFNKGKATVMVELGSRLIGKKVAAIHIADDGTIEQLAGKVLTVGGKQYYEFMTPHFSTFAIVDADEVGLDAAEEPAVDAKALVSKLTPAVRSAKTAKKNVKVTASLDKQDKEIISQLKDAGYMVKYRFYRSTKKAAGYKAAVTKKASTYTSTSGKKGTKYFYKVQVRVYDASGKLAAKTALKQCRYASRTWNK